MDHVGGLHIFFAVPFLRILTVAVSPSNSVMWPRSSTTCVKSPVSDWEDSGSIFFLDYLYHAVRCNKRFGSNMGQTMPRTAHGCVERAIVGPKRRKITPVSSWGSSFYVIPPSSACKLRQLTNLVQNDVWASEIPFIYRGTHEERETNIELWKQILTCHTGQESNPTVPVPVSTCIHENEQLMYGRAGVPLCSNGHACSAYHVQNNQGPLHIYLMPSEQERLNSGKPCYFKEEQSPYCLLCIRTAMSAAAFACESIQPHAQTDVRRGANFPLAFCNLVDVPGGYKSSAMIPNAHIYFHSCNLVNENLHALTGKYDPAQRRWRICQDSLIYSPGGQDF